MSTLTLRNVLLIAAYLAQLVRSLWESVKSDYRDFKMPGVNNYGWCKSVYQNEIIGVMKIGVVSFLPQYVFYKVILLFLWWHECQCSSVTQSFSFEQLEDRLFDLYQMSKLHSDVYKSQWPWHHMTLILKFTWHFGATFFPALWTF
jgi:hypothetical protein